MYRTTPKTIYVNQTVVICDRCGREVAPDDHHEYEERIAIRFRAGPGSLFGDGSLVELDFCQHCVKDTLGPWLRVTQDNPHAPKQQITPPAVAHHAYQEYQLRQLMGAEELLKRLRVALANEIQGRG